MKVNKILVYGERLGSLREATDLVEGVRRGDPPGPDDVAVITPLMRAVGRASAELLLRLADSAHPSNLMWVEEYLIGLAYRAVLDEVDAVLRDPLVLHSHPALAAVSEHRSSSLDVEEPV